MKELKCNYCGNLHNGEYGSGKFCSSKCARGFAGKIYSGTKVVNCISCGKEIIVSKKASGKLCKCDDCRNYKKYITKKNIYNNEIEIFNKTCLMCGVDIGYKSKKYCSSDCHREYELNEYIDKWKRGEVDGSISGGTAISGYVRRYLWKKYDRKCSRCGWDTPNPITKKPVLEIEHIDGDSTNNKEENLDLICPNCHSLTTTYKALNTGKGNRKRLKYHKLI